MTKNMASYINNNGGQAKVQTPVKARPKREDVEAYLKGKYLCVIKSPFRMLIKSPVREFFTVLLTVIAALLMATALFFCGTEIIIPHITDPHRRSDFSSPLIDQFGISCVFVLPAALFDIFFLILIPRRFRSISVIAVLSVVCGVAIVALLNHFTIVYRFMDVSNLLETSVMGITGICVPFIYKSLRKLLSSQHS
jgi:hypothetical protein